MNEWQPYPRPSDESHAAMQAEHADNLGADVALAVAILKRRSSELRERLVALEGKVAPASEPVYKPGFTTDKGAGMGNFQLDEEEDPDDIFFEIDGDTCIIQLCVDGEEHWLEGVTVEGMKHVIGAAQAVLKRMEAK